MDRRTDNVKPYVQIKDCLDSENKHQQHKTIGSTFKLTSAIFLRRQNLNEITSKSH